MSVAVPSFEVFGTQLADHLNRPDLARVDRTARLLDDLHLDSLHLYEMVVWVDDEVGGEIPVEEIAALETFGDVYDLLVKHRVADSTLTEP